MAYDGERALFEAYARNKYHSTGLIQWMLNNAWPSVVWHLYDYFLQPAGGYFGTKKACEPLHVQYSYDTRGVDVINNLYSDYHNLTVTAALYDFDLRQKFFRKVTINTPADSVEQAFVIPEISPAPKLSFLKITLEDRSGKVLSSNFYWLPAKASVFDWDLARTNEHAYYSAVISYEDLTTLNHLPPAELRATAEVEHGGGGDAVRVRLQNPSNHLAFQIRLGVRDAQHDEVLPVFWEDNYFSLLPGESLVVTARYPTHTLGPHYELNIEGWNFNRVTVPVTETGKSAVGE
jgi:exo-1,4-beta-D-glucosaminidase